MREEKVICNVCQTKFNDLLDNKFWVDVNTVNVEILCSTPGYKPDIEFDICSRCCKAAMKAVSEGKEK
jgi:hypothetical protein